ncbi:MAG: selenium-dependent xanthine dehydrogenase [Gaiellaceae bacterium]
MELTLNGERVTAHPRDDESLLELLREHFGLCSVKDGCAPEGSCGACTVIVDGHAVVSCAQKAERVEGKHVMTQEGLSDETRRRWADCFVAAGASQCGYCSPGIVMKAEALLAKNPDPSRDEIAHALLGNLCRCTGYVKVVDAIRLAAAARRGEPLPTPDTSGRVGSRTARYRGSELALGDAPYVGDMTAPGMLHGALCFSAHPRARVRRIDTTRAQAHPGVVAVLTAADVPGDRTQGSLTKDWRQLVAEGETTAYVGDVLAAVAAETRHAAREAAELIEVEYEVLEPVTDPFESLAKSAPQLHEGGNVLSVSRVTRGDVDAGLAASAHVVSESFRTQFIEHAFLEPESAFALREQDGTLHVYSQGQGIWDDRRQIASFLGVAEEQVRVTQVTTGGAFGAKEDLNVQGHAALLVTATGRPVRLTLSRKESLRFHSKRHAMWLEYTVGCDAEGHLTALQARIVGDTGAYASVGDKVLERAAGHACGAYRVPNVDIEATAVYTNNPPCGAMRGFGVNQSNFAVEGVLDMLAERVGIDGWEMRWRNALDVGDRTGTGQKLGPGVGLKKTLLAVRDAYRDARYAGIACGLKNTGIGNGVTEFGRAILRPEADGTITLYHSWTEMGQGVHTVLRQIACEELGFPPERIHVKVDTERELETGQTTASRSTVLGGNAVIDAARQLKAALADASLESLAGREFRGDVVVDWTTENGADVEEPVTHIAYGWATQVVILDDEGAIEKVIAAHDVGKAINPTLIEGQVEGAVHMGLGQALSEEFVVEGGVPLNETLKSLHIIPPTGMPDVECILVEEPQPEGPYGAKGIGEAALVPTAAAAAGALHAFDGIRRVCLPMKESPAAQAAVPHLVSRRR